MTRVTAASSRASRTKGGIFHGYFAPDGSSGLGPGLRGSNGRDARRGRVGERADGDHHTPARRHVGVLAARSASAPGHDAPSVLADQRRHDELLVLLLQAHVVLVVGRRMRLLLLT